MSKETNTFSELFKPSQKLILVYKLYELICLLVGVFFWLGSYVIMNFFIDSSILNMFSVLTPLITLFFVLFSFFPLIFLYSYNMNGKFIFCIFTFIILPVMIIISLDLFWIFNSSYSYLPTIEIPVIAQEFLTIMLTLIQILACFIWYHIWISKSYKSISYKLDNKELIQKKGFLIKSEVFLTYSKIISINIKQGPIFRKFGIGTLQIYTARQFNTSKPEINIEGIENYEELRKHIMQIVHNLEK